MRLIEDKKKYETSNYSFELVYGVENIDLKINKFKVKTISHKN